MANIIGVVSKQPEAVVDVLMEATVRVDAPPKKAKPRSMQRRNVLEASKCSSHVRNIGQDWVENHAESVWANCRMKGAKAASASPHRLPAKLAVFSRVDMLVQA